MSRRNCNILPFSELKQNLFTTVILKQRKHKTDNRLSAKELRLLNEQENKRKLFRMFEISHHLAVHLPLNSWFCWLHFSCNVIINIIVNIMISFTLNNRCSLYEKMPHGSCFTITDTLTRETTENYNKNNNNNNKTRKITQFVSKGELQVSHFFVCFLCADMHFLLFIKPQSSMWNWMLCLCFKKGMWEIFKFKLFFFFSLIFILNRKRNIQNSMKKNKKKEWNVNEKLVDTIKN